VSFENILELWGDTTPEHKNELIGAEEGAEGARKTCRLILVCDCENADQWLRRVSMVRGEVFIGTFSTVHIMFLRGTCGWGL